MNQTIKSTFFGVSNTTGPPKTRPKHCTHEAKPVEATPENRVAETILLYK